MSTETARDLQRYYVTSSWVKDYYQVNAIDVLRAVRDGRLRGHRVRGPQGGYGLWIFDVRDLPDSWPRPRMGLRRENG